MAAVGRSWLEQFHEETELNLYPVAYRYYGGVGYRKPNGEIVSSFACHPVHYFDAGEMKPITLAAHSNGDFEGVDFAWKGKQVLYKGSRLFEPRAVILDGKRFNLKFFKDKNIIRAALPFGEYRIIFNENGVREELEILEPVEGLLEFDVIHAVKPGRLHKQKRHKVKGDFAESFLLDKGMNYPILIDPDYSSDPADGVITGSNSVFSIARSTATSVYTPATAYQVGGYGYSGFQVHRLFLKFLTGGIPDSDMVTGVNITMHTNQVLSFTYAVNVLISKYNWAGLDPLSEGNKQSAFYGCLTADLDDAILGNTGGMVGDAFYTSGALNTSWVNKTGGTYYGMLIDRDRDNLIFGNYQAVEFHSANETTYPTYRPRLTVFHEALPVGMGDFFSVL